MVALNTAEFFLNTLGYTTNIDYDFLVCQNFIHQKREFNILNKQNECVGKISFYDFNQKILISLGKENGKNSYPLGRWDIALTKPHTVKGYLFSKPKEHLALEMIRDYSEDFAICFKGEYLKDNQHMAFTIQDNKEFWFTKTWLNNKEIVKLNLNNKEKESPLLKHTLFVNQPVPMIKEERIYEEESFKLKGLKEVTPKKEKTKVLTFTFDEDSLIKAIGIFMKNLNPHYQENMMMFNQDLNGLLGRFLSVALPNCSFAELEALFGFKFEKVQLKDSLCLMREKN